MCSGRMRLMRTVNFAEQVQQSVEDNPNASTRAIVQQPGVSISHVADAAQETCAFLPSAKSVVHVEMCH
ncbi:hypothetical protein HNY73_021998 [Argiope bruennichi]|uniref:Uncharacterized protein n=1 Tax=Argiope bruennichi TaxID=94029 RepID=A0A8T0E091_ARGBR|nr:hypothetical protein HNY73_021998 [Argiope bruennichi]